MSNRKRVFLSHVVPIKKEDYPFSLSEATKACQENAFLAFAVSQFTSKSKQQVR